MNPAAPNLRLVPDAVSPVDAATVAMLRALERKVLWLSSWMIHNANHVRPKRDGLKVGGHQASSASLATLMTALYFHTLRPQDRVAVKPHASPVFHAIQYLLGHQTLAKLEGFRALGGAQSYPSRTKDDDDVDFSTGSVGLGVAETLFASMVRDYVHLKGLAGAGDTPGRMVALVGDAEFDEGNVFEAMLEGWKHDVRNLWWVIDYNRQSLDSVVSDLLFQRIIDHRARFNRPRHTRRQPSPFQISRLQLEYRPGRPKLLNQINRTPRTQLRRQPQSQPQKLFLFRNRNHTNV